MDYNAGKFGRGFDTSFTIPRMRHNIAASNKNAMHQSSAVLSNAYYNIPSNYPSSIVPNYDNQLSQSWADFLRRSYKDPNSTPNATSNLTQQNPLKRTWLNANTSKTSATRYKDTFGDLHDMTLPKELLLLFQPLFCKLCMIQLSSNVMAKLHYKSKNHDKQVRTWLTEYSKKTGEPLHKRATVPRLKNEEDYDPKHFHCDVCDLALTGKAHAESHYMGKNHQRASYGKKNPTGKGYVNDEGKWTRTQNAKKTNDESDGFGLDFDKNALKSPRIIPGGLKCDICNVNVTSLPQLEAHYQGQRHNKKVKHMEAAAVVGSSENTETKSEATATTDQDVLSSYRTPSGQFYCKTCNLSMNSEMQFLQHLKSKKHARKLEPPSPETPQTADDIFLHL